ncbi:MAG: EAL domain-containing protein, partial [Spirochaetales bacterium]|nr:EAL domain-containing protein [Spirochaetales bacterium]
MATAEREANEIHALLAETTSEAAIHLDCNGRVLYVNPAFTRMFGYKDEVVLRDGAGMVFAGTSKRRFDQKIADCLNGAERSASNLRAVNSRGRQLPVRVTIIPHRWHGDPAAMVLIRDISEQLKVTEELEALKSSYSALSETVSDPILQLNESFRIVFANSAVERVFGYSAEELLKKEFSSLFPPSVHNRYDEVFRKYFVIDDVHRQASKLGNAIEVLGQNKDGDIVPLEISFGNSRSVQGERLVTCIIRDISQRKKTERKLKYLAYHDKLTDLGNRDLFYITLEQFLSHVKRYKDTIGAVLFLDLDGFKKVNDTLGHNVGDILLCSCAHRLSGCLRESDHVYRFSAEPDTDSASHEDLFRFGGDEFVILLNQLKKPTDAAVVSQKIIDTIRRPYKVEGIEPGTKINIGVSIGIALIPQNGLDAMQLIKHADMAMYKAKERGNRYMYFTSELNKQASERLFLENGIRKALDQKIFDLHYQPIVGIRGTIEGAEALLRWHDRRRGYISPMDFIPVAEETGLILPLGDWVFETACRQLKSWNSEGFEDLYVSINLSVKQFSQEHIVDKLSRIIERTEIEPKNLKIEITESSIMPEPAEARKKMEELKKRHPGIRIAIDDFGTGYSSLSYLSDFPVDILKIDQSFVINMYKKGTTKIINTIITLGNSLLMDVIAEGVETKNQLEYLLSRNCKSFQGYYFGKPISATALTQMLKSYKPPL